MMSPMGLGKVLLFRFIVQTKLKDNNPIVVNIDFVESRTFHKSAVDAVEQKVRGKL